MSGGVGLNFSSVVYTLSFHRALNRSESYFSPLEGERVALDNQSLRTRPGGGPNPRDRGGCGEG